MRESKSRRTWAATEWLKDVVKEKRRSVHAQLWITVVGVVKVGKEARLQ